MTRSTGCSGLNSWVLAMQCSRPPLFADDEDILMLYGDVPLISVETLTRLRAAKPQGGIGLLTVVLDDQRAMAVSRVRTTT